MDKSHSYQLYNSVHVVLGFKNAIIVDTNRQSFRSIPRFFGELLLKYEQTPFNRIALEPEDLSIFISNIYELEKLDCLFVNKTNLKFAERNKTWFNSSLISNAIFLYSEKWYFNQANLARQFNQLGCQSIEIRIDNRINFEKLKALVSCFSDFECLNISLYLIKGTDIAEGDLSFLFELDKRLVNIHVFQSKVNRQIQIGSLDQFICFNKTMAHVHKSCGNVNPDQFNGHHLFVSEARNHNSCLNRKITIDERGNIKNCPAMKISYGNIEDVRLKEVIQKAGFKKLWNINKDKIQGCKDCEYRYICTDCRAYVEDPENPLSKPLKCGYDPYKGEWFEWSSNPLKQKAIDFYGIGESVKINT